MRSNSLPYGYLPPGVSGRIRQRDEIHSRTSFHVIRGLYGVVLSFRALPGALSLTFGLLASSCGRRAPASDTSRIAGVVCTADARPGILVEVRDSTTGAPLSNAALRILSNGRVVDSARSPEARQISVLTLAGVYEQPGIYDVVVERRGYVPWRRDSVLVGHDECHVITVHLIANMSPILASTRRR